MRRIPRKHRVACRKKRHYFDRRYPREIRPGANVLPACSAATSRAVPELSGVSFGNPGLRFEGKRGRDVGSEHIARRAFVVNDDWFQRLNALIARTPSRRQVAGLLSSTLLMSTLSPSTPDAEATDKRKRRKKRKRKNSGSNDQASRCGKAICNEHFTGNGVDDCTAKCGRCRIKSQFCVIGGDPLDPSSVATCCFEDQQCCQESLACCAKNATCCPGYPEAFPGPCCPEGTSCCASDTNGCCESDQTCCPGRGCIDVANSADHCGACENRCPPGALCYEGECRDCPPGEKLCQTRDRPTPSCVPESSVCCPGFVCANPDGNVSCCVSSAGVGYCSFRGACPV
jgi:hypothetical protein